MKDTLLRYSALYTATTFLAGAISNNVVWANPTGGQVVGGNAHIVSTPHKTDIYQQTEKAVINWRTFDIQAGEHTQFHQPSANAATLNRVTGGLGASQIDGKLTANGNVVLVNPDGIMFGKDANINVGGLLATTADSTTADFMQGKTNFSKAGNPDARIVNDGTITAKDAGLVGLVAPHVENNGTITATLGKVTLGAAETFTVDLYGDKLIHLGVSEKTARQLVRNTGKINAAGGEVTLSASAGKQVVENLVQVKGEIRTPTVAEKAGKIIITGNDAEVALSNAKVDASGEHKAGTILIGGDLQGTGTTARANNTTIDANSRITANANTTGDGGKVIVWADDRTRFAGTIEAQGGKNAGNGGFVETSGKETLSVTGQVVAKARAKGHKEGTWLLDPRNVTITSSTTGGTFSGGNPDSFTPTADSATVLNTTINNALDNGTTVIITTNDSDGNMSQSGDITLAADITKSSGASDAGLILRAANNIVSSGTRRIEVTGGTGKLNVKLNSDSDNSGAGAISLTNTTVNTNGGNFSAGGGNLASNGGVAANYDNAAVALTDFAVGTSAYDDGVYFSNIDITTGAGDITLRGNGYNVAVAGFQQGISLNDGSALTTTSGAITIEGTGGNGTTGNNSGIRLDDTGTLLTSATGNISLTGNGGGNYDYSRGIDVFGGSAISSTGSGTITLNGTGGGSGGNGVSNYGIILSDDDFEGDPDSLASITSSGGAITIHGTGGTGTGGVHVGVYMDGASSISGTNSADVSITGIGGTQGNFNQGIYLDGAGRGTATFSTVNGNLTVDGTATQGPNSRGVVMFNESTISSSGSGNITVTGNSSTASTDIGMGGGGTHTLGHATGTGTITINADEIELQAGTSILSNTGNIIVKPRTNSTTIGIANGATGVLNIDSTELGYFSTNGLFEIGDRNNGTGAVDMRAWDWSSKSHNVLVAGGALSVNGAQTLATNKNLTLLSRDIQDITLSDSISPASGSGQVNLLATQHIRANSNVQHNGTGQVNAVAGWNGTNGLNADGSVTIGTITGTSSYYGNNSGSVFINNAAGTQGVAVGSKDGATTVAGYDLTLRGGSNSDNYAHLGYELTTGSATGDIAAYISNDTSLIGSTSASRGYVQIGHGSESDTFTSASGNITLRTRDLSVSNVGAWGRSYGLIGHGGYAAHGTKSGNIDITARAVSVTSGTGATNLLAQIGHGGQGSTGTMTGNITLNATGDINLQSGWNAAIIGNAQPFGGSGDVTGNISINTTGNLIINAPSLGELAQIGNGGQGTNGNFSGNITTIAQNITLLGSGGNRVTIGHGNGSGTRQGNIIVTSLGELSVVENGGTANIGHLSSDGTGVFSNANVRVISNSLDFADDAVDATSFDINDNNFISRMTDNLAGGDVTIASKNAPLTLSNAWSATSASSRNLNFLSYGDITVNENLTHNGNGGRINVIAGWDGTNGINPTDGSIDFSTLRLRDATDVGVLTLANTKTITAGATSGTGIIAAAADRFTNNNAAGGLSAAGSRYVIYSTDSGVTTLGTLTPSSLGGGYALRQPAGIAAGNYIIYDSNGNLVLLVSGQTYTYNGAAQLVTSAGAAGYGTYYSLDAASLTSLTGSGYTIGNFTGSLTGNATFSATDSTNATTGADITGNINTLASSLGYTLSFDNTPINELIITAAASSGGGWGGGGNVTPPPTPSLIESRPPSPSVVVPPAPAPVPIIPPAPVDKITVTPPPSPAVIPYTVQSISQNGMPVLASPAPTSASSETASSSSQENEDQLDYGKESNGKITHLFGNLIAIHPKIAKIFGINRL